MMIAEEAVMCGKGRGVGGLKDEMFIVVNKGGFSASIATPEDEDEMGTSIV